MGDLVNRLRHSWSADKSIISQTGEWMKERTEAADEIERLRAELSWYGEQARLARLIHSGGDVGRHALAADGGKRARAVLQRTE